ncbi:hypothetical protein LWI29_004688 [Acer saccharum]|uniref:Uncharacterized protein n=1 Tax=Acer saccharum TaxID=4024 RepID=A0AA39SBG3_ACESA|nr:hypothetical protein LWI29_004688 [Acer saccharum]
MQFEQNCQIELLIHKRPPEVDITILEELNREQNKQVKKLCDQQEAFKLQPKSTASSLDASSNSQVVVERIEMVLEENGACLTNDRTYHQFYRGGSHIQARNRDFIYRCAIYGPEKLQKSQLVTCSLNVAMEFPEEFGQEQQPENLSDERPTENGLTAVEQQMQGQKLVDQLPPLSQMPSKPQLTTTTCITKQRGKTKKRYQINGN